MPYELITSRQNKRVKDTAKLRDGRSRRKTGLTIIDGLREIERAIASGVQVEAAFLLGKTEADAQASPVAAQLESQGALVSLVTPDVFEKLAFGSRDEGIVAVARVPNHSLETFNPPPGSILAVLEGIEKPGNLGAIARSADGSGVAGILVADLKTDLYNPSAIRASIGTLFSIPHVEGTSREILAWLQAKEIPIFITRPDASLLHTEVDFSHGGAIVLGSEAEGLTDDWSSAHVTSIRLPMRGIADSLNVSAAAAVLFYEAMRERFS